MKLIKKYGIAIYWILLFLDCILITIKPLEANRIYTKPLLVLALAAYFYVNTKRSKHWRSKILVYVGLTFNWVSDFLFLAYDFKGMFDYSNEMLQVFLFLGLCSTFIALLIYTYSFSRIKSLNFKDCQEAFLATLAMFIVSIIFYKTIRKEELSFFKPIIIIGIIVLTITMAFAANVMNDKVRKNLGTKYFIPGAISLVLSTGLIIAHIFYLKEAEFLPAVIELTYGFGLMLFVRGFTKYLKA